MAMLSTDWQSSKSLTESHLYLFQNEIETDVEFMAGEEEKEIVRAHRIILASRSPVFYAMFYGQMKEKDKIIPLPDIEPDSLKVLKFLYTDTATLNESNVMDILNAAKKYCVDHLVELCETYLCSNLTTENLAAGIEASDEFKLTDLYAFCILFIVKYSSIIFHGNYLDSLRFSSLETIIASDFLAVDETVIFEWLINRWSKAECARQQVDYTNDNVRQVLGGVLYKVRFPLMHHNYLAGNIVKHLLTTREIDDLPNLGNRPSRNPGYFQRNLRMNIFDALGWSTMYTDNDAESFSISPTCSAITLKSLILKTKYSDLKIEIKSEKENYLLSSEIFRNFSVALKDNERGKYVNVILPGDGYSFKTKTTVELYTKFVTKKKEFNLDHL